MTRWMVLLAALAAANPAPAQERVAELERKVDVLTQEIEQLKLGAVADTARAGPRLGFAPGASKVYGVGRGVSVGGYGEMLLQRFGGEREDGVPVNAAPRLDYVRNVLYVGYKFDDQVLFNSELEVEHAGVSDEAHGEVVLEFAYLDWAPRREIGVRAGMLLVPVGLVNEWHESPVLIGARRPEVEQRILPTTWRVNGAGVFGELPVGLAYRAYLTEGLDAGRFTAENGIREGRQAGSEARVLKPALSGRVDWTGTAGLLLGASAYTGDSWQESQPADTLLEPRVTVADLHARLEWRGLQARVVLVRGWLDDAGDLSDHLGLTGPSRLGRSFWGYYVEAAYDVLPLAYPGTRYGLLPYARFERSDTQDDVPGGSEDPANDRITLTTGLALKPHPNVVLKLDHQQRRNQAKTGVDQWNAAVGYLF
ncbi:MAG: hypothetical protein ACRENJ_11965 [Candidatus Eiseniibacteriota bacterium]